MGVKIRKRGGKWYVFVNYHGRRKAKCVGASRQVAEQVKRQLEAKLALGDLGFLTQSESRVQTFDAYADCWMKDYARVECKTSTADGYEGVLRQYLRPRFGSKRLGEVSRDDIKALINELVAKELSRNTVRNALCVIRGIFNHAIEGAVLESNPAARLGRFTRTAKTAETKGVALTPAEVKSFLEAAKEICADYYALFLTAMRAGLRRGELVALQWGDIQFGKDESDPNRFMIVRHNYVRREHTTTKSKKSRRVDLSRELRHVLIELRDKRLLEAFLKGKNDISDELVFRSPEGSILDPDNLYHRYFLPVLMKAGIRKVRLHDLRHTFGSLLIQNGASIVYVKEQMGHSSIQITVDIYGHLIPGANVCFVDRLDEVLEQEEKTTPQQNATPAQPAEAADSEISTEAVGLIGGGGWTRTNDLRIMRPSL
jgi:integrase